VSKLKILFISPYYPTVDNPYDAPFMKRSVDALKIEEDLDVDFYHFKAKRKISNYLKGRNEIKKILARKQYDVIHLNWGQSIVILPFNLTERLVVTFRGGDILGIINKYGIKSWVSLPTKLISKYAAKRADACICVSSEIKEKLNQHHKSIIIPSGVKKKLFPKLKKAEARQKLGIALDSIVLLFVGNPKNARKRYELATKLVAEIKITHHRIELITVWKKEPQKVYDYMYAADYLLQVSLQEGSPNVVKEALMCNLRVISTPVGDTKERITHLPGCVVSNSFEYEVVLKAINLALTNHTNDTVYDYSKEINNFTLSNEVSKVKQVYYDTIM
jgi:teichuronic acid biosynthesis glycosyltransferase TuaC